MIIILEGPDGSGKSVLAQRLSLWLGYPIVRRGHPKSSTEKNKLTEEYLAYIAAGKNVILDRCWYSEMVYGPVMQDIGTDDYLMSLEQMYELEDRLKKAGAMIIFCTDEFETLWNRCCIRGEEYILSKEKFRQIYNGYLDLFLNTSHNIPLMVYSIPNDTTVRVL